MSCYVRKQEELNSWILRLGKADLVVTQSSDRRPQTSLYKNKSTLLECDYLKNVVNKYEKYLKNSR